MLFNTAFKDTKGEMTSWIKLALFKKRKHVFKFFKTEIILHMHIHMMSVSVHQVPNLEKVDVHLKK